MAVTEPKNPLMTFLSLRAARAAAGVLAALALATMAACGGGGGDSPAATQAASPPPDPAAGASAPAPADMTCATPNFQADAIRLINQKRASGAVCGSKGTFPPAPAVAWNDKLTNAAYVHSLDMADHNYFSHTSQDGRAPGDRVTAAGYIWSTIGENIAAGYPSVQAVVDGWMTSEGHCANLMNASFRDIGMACAANAASTYRTYWTLELGAPR